MRLLAASTALDAESALQLVPALFIAAVRVPVHQLLLRPLLHRVLPARHAPPQRHALLAVSHQAGMSDAYVKPFQ